MRHGKALCAFIILILLFVSGAQAEEDGALQITAVLDPQEMVAPDEAEIVITLINTSASDVVDVTVSSYDGLTTVEVGDLAPGETRTLTRAHVVTEEELAQGRVVFTVSYASQTSPGTTVNHIVSAYVVRAIAAPEAEFTRTLSAVSSAAGSEVTAVYSVTNTGNEPLTNIRVQDSFGDFSGRADSLGVGETVTFVNRVVMTQDGESAASLTYSAASLEGTRTVSLSPESIRMEQPLLILSLSASEEEGGAVDLQLTLRNGGGAAFTDVRVFDAENGGLLFDGISLAPGEEKTLTRTCPVRGQSAFRFRVEARDGAGNRYESEISSPIAQKSGTDALLTLTAEPAAQEISGTGYVTVRVTLLAAGGGAEAVRLREAGLGEIRTFAVVPAGVEVVREVRLPVEEDVTLLFTAEYENADGETVMVEALPVTIRITPNGAEPEPFEEETDHFRGASRKIGESGVYTVMLLGVGVVLLLLFILLRVGSRREKQRQRAEKRRRRKEDEDV